LDTNNDPARHPDINPDTVSRPMASFTPLLGSSTKARRAHCEVRSGHELNTVDAFLPQRTGPIPGSTRLHPQLERLMRAHH